MDPYKACKLHWAFFWCLAVAISQVGASERSIVDELRRFDFDLAQPTFERNGAGTNPPTSLASTWATDMADASTPPPGVTTSMTVYKRPDGWWLTLLKNMFTDIDWNTIEEARCQIEKFVYRVEQMVGKFRNVFTMVGGNKSQTPTSGDLRLSADHPKPSARMWGKKDSSSSTASKLDATRVKEMLERVACFVGYARLMNLSNEALAELDASKVVTNLFGGAGKRNSSGWKWFG